jgi:hypothetical protein
MNKKLHRPESWQERQENTSSGWTSGSCCSTVLASSCKEFDNSCSLRSGLPGSVPDAPSVTCPFGIGLQDSDSMPCAATACKQQPTPLAQHYHSSQLQYHQPCEFSQHSTLPQSGFLVKPDRIFVPSSLQPRTHSQAYSSHQSLLALL